MDRIRKIGIITSGGDCGGLNAVIKGAASMALHKGIIPCVITNGYAGLYNLHKSDNLAALRKEDLESIDAGLAGSAAGNSRVKISKIEDANKYEAIRQGLSKYAVDALVIAGGDDTGSVVMDLVQNGIPCVHVPKTMDLDLQTYSVGGDSSVNRIADYIRELKTTGKSHNRVMIVEVFGRYSGRTALLGGTAGEADCILIPEVPIDFDRIYEDVKRKLLSRIEKSPFKCGTYVIVVSEGLTDNTGGRMSDDSQGADAFGHRKLGGTGKYVREQISARIKADGDIADFLKRQGLFVENMNCTFEVRETAPGYLIRSGVSTALDAVFGIEAGAGAVELLASGISNVTVAGVKEGVVQYVPIRNAVQQRYVEPETIAFYESLGVCFGRKPEAYNAKAQSLEKPHWRYF